MFELITKGVAKIFGTKSDRDLKLLTPLVGQINEEYVKLSAITDDELRGKTDELKSVISEKLKDIDDELEELHQKVANEPQLDINEKDEIFKKIDQLRAFYPAS
jgi:preprotein translocase subunit SecA